MVIRDPKQGVEYDPMATQQGRVRVSSIEATAEVVQDQLKRGKSGRWEIICDEGPQPGGSGRRADTPTVFCHGGPFLRDDTNCAVRAVQEGGD